MLRPQDTRRRPFCALRFRDALNELQNFKNYLRPPKGERSDTPAAHVASVRDGGVTAYMTADGNAGLLI